MTLNNKLSVVIATYNEAQNIVRCLESIKDIADEIVIVDGSSSDNTVDLAKQFKAQITITTNKPIFHINKQMAIDLSHGQWILQLDADEVVSSSLATEIKTVINMDEDAIRNRLFNSSKQKLFKRHLQTLIDRGDHYNQESSETVAFFIPRLNMFLEKPLKHGGVYPDGVIRLIKKGKAHFPCVSVHEQIEVNGRVDWLENDLLHYDSPTLNKYILRAKRYTSLTAKELEKQSTPKNLISYLNFILLKPVLTFINLYFRHKGFLDGIPGLIFAFGSALHYPVTFIKYIKSS